MKWYIFIQKCHKYRIVASSNLGICPKLIQWLFLWIKRNVSFFVLDYSIFLVTKGFAESLFGPGPSVLWPTERVERAMSINFLKKVLKIKKRILLSLSPSVILFCGFLISNNTRFNKKLRLAECLVIFTKNICNFKEMYSITVKRNCPPRHLGARRKAFQLGTDNI